MTKFCDRTYCSSDCVNRDCDRNLTPDIRAAAEQMWGKNPPIDVADYRAGCREYAAPAADPAFERCEICGSQPIRAELDGDPLCQKCCDAWARGEGRFQLTTE